jgi:pyruvate dehydrogenase E1 component alpha subunit
MRKTYFCSIFEAEKANHKISDLMDQTVEKAKNTGKATAKSKKPKYSKEQYLSWYETMFRIRKFEERALMMYGQQKIRGFLHVYIGQEAITAGMESAISPDDAIVTAYRQHGTAIGRGISTKEAMAELFGKATGVNKGKGGSMHFFSKEHRYFGGNGIVGAQIPIGTGIAFAEKYRKTKNLCVTMFGDGAARQGALHESFNMATNWQLPVLYICENNHYAMGTSVSRTANHDDIYKLGLGYHMPSEPVDGMHPESVYEGIKKAVEHIRAGKGPYFLELKTYRYKGHSVSDPGAYRSKDEVSDYKDKDPVKMAEQTLKDLYQADEEIKAIKAKIKKEIDAAVQFAEESPFPDPSELFTDNYVQEDYPFITD